MKRVIQYLSIFVLLTTIFSCQITEKIELHEDGSGTYSLNLDMSDTMHAIANRKDSINTDKEREKLETIDTLILFKDLIDVKKDSIAHLTKEEQKLIESIEDFKFHMILDEATNKLITDFIYDFKKMDDLENIQERISKAQAIQENKNRQKPTSNTTLHFSFDGKKFSRKVKDKNWSQEEKDAYKKYLEKNFNLLDGSSYGIEYRFPRPIKSTNYDAATFSGDRKTLYIKTDLKTISQNPKLLDFEVILE